MSEINLKQNFPLAVIVGFAASLVAAFLWAAVTFVTGSKAVFMPIGVGLIIGYAVRLSGKGNTFLFGLTGAIFTLLGCFLGHILSMITASASARNTSVFTILSAVSSSNIDAEFFAESYSTNELLSCAAAILIGFILSFYRFSSKKSVQMNKS